MNTVFLFSVLVWSLGSPPVPPEARLVRHPHYHDGRIAFSYFSDIWTADETGRNIRRLTVHAARDAFPRFSPDGNWIAFSSDRAGDMNVYVMPVEGGMPTQLTFHSAGDQVLGWTPDSRAVLFTSNRRDDFVNKLYTVGVEGGMPVDIGVDMGYYASYSPDGTRLAYNRKSQQYWRKRYRGSNQSDVTIMDIRAGRFTQLTDFAGMDRWPMWSSNGYVYFVSDRGDGAIANIWRVPEGGGDAEPVTTFSDGETRWPAMSADGRVIVFERDFVLWKLDLPTGQARPIPLNIAAETQVSLNEMHDFRSEVDDYDLAPGGRRIAFSIHGEVFTAPTREGDLVRLTSGASRDQRPVYSPDGEWVAFLSDQGGRPELYLTATEGNGDARRVSDLDALKTSVAWSPDSKAIAYAASDNVLRRYDLESGRTVRLAQGEWGSPGSVTWSPDGNWIAFTKPNHMRTQDVYLVPSDGGDERPVTFDSYSDVSPHFSPDGRKLYFIRNERLEAAITGPPSADIYAVTLEREARDPNEPTEEEGEDEMPARAQRDREPPAEVTIDWDGLERRTRRLTRMAFPVSTFTVSPDGETIAFVTREQRGGRTVPVIQTVKADGEGLRRVATAVPAGGGGGPGPGFGFGGGITTLRFAPTGRTLFFKEGNYVYSVGLRPAGPTAESSDSPGSAGQGPAGRSAPRRRINFVARVRIEKRAEWMEMFDDAWFALKHRFYDPGMHGTDWNAMRARYRPLVEHVGTRDGLIDVLREMIGEMNASHSGASGATPDPGSQRVQTHHLGLSLDADPSAGRYRVTHVFEGGPADHDWVSVAEGDYLIAIDGEEVRAGDNYWPLLNHHLNDKVELTLSRSASGDDAWTTRIEPVSVRAYGQLRYERWVTGRREMVHELSDGRIGYVHIQSMNQPSLKKFEKELRENRTREALIIDQRWNGGGNIEQQLLALLLQRRYQTLEPRASQPSFRPAGGFFGPMVVLENWRSGSNAEMFPAGFSSLGLGKVIGTPSAGAVIGSGSYRLIDGSTVRTPGSGVFITDAERTNLENYGVPPDILVENTPEEHLAGEDKVIEAAVRELLTQLGRTAEVASKQ